MNTNMTGFRWFSNILRPCALDESSLSIGRVNEQPAAAEGCQAFRCDIMKSKNT